MNEIGNDNFTLKLFSSHSMSLYSCTLLARKSNIIAFHIPFLVACTFSRAIINQKNLHDSVYPPCTHKYPQDPQETLYSKGSPNILEHLFRYNIPLLVFSPPM